MKIPRLLQGGLIAALLLVSASRSYAQVLLGGPETALLIEFGVVLEEKDNQMVVASVLPLPAEKTGGARLKEGDVVLSLNGKAVKTLAEWRKSFSPLKEGDAVTIEVSSVGKTSKYTSKRANPEGGVTFRSDDMKTSGNTTSFSFKPGSGGSGSMTAAKVTAHLPGAVFKEEDEKVIYTGTMNFNNVPPVETGFKPNDVILGLNGTMVKSFAELDDLLKKTEAGSNLRFAVQRGSERMFLDVTKPARQ